MFYKLFIKPVLFLFPPETAHGLTLFLFKVLLKTPLIGGLFKRYCTSESNVSQVSFCNLSFPNRIGLAAGFDKNGEYLHEMPALGFGFIELGTVTPKPQDGNPQPRLFRLPGDDALLNRMGFNNRGVDFLVEQLIAFSRPKGLIIGGNIGKNKDTPNENALDDYLICFEKLFTHVDYFVVNVSSPNTPGLRALQEKEPLTLILTALQQANNRRINSKPILLKIAPDLELSQIDDIIEVVQSTKCHGLVVSNTTSDRMNLSTDSSLLESFGSGGISGKPVREKSNQLIAYIFEKTNGMLPIIGVGGVSSVEDAKNKLKAGATLIQIYTGLVYEGPFLVKNLVGGTNK
jgi:dihydroorotate dehydrogenase